MRASAFWHREPSTLISLRAVQNARAIKAHHNVGGLPDDMKFELVEPVKYLYKDEVGHGTVLGLPDSMVYRQPFPGPGLGVNVLARSP